LVESVKKHPQEVTGRIDSGEERPHPIGRGAKNDEQGKSFRRQRFILTLASNIHLSIAGEIDDLFGRRIHPKIKRRKIREQGNL
jgi:hypothetical protein